MRIRIRNTGLDATFLLFIQTHFLHFFWEMLHISQVSFPFLSIPEHVSVMLEELIFGNHQLCKVI